MGRPARGTESLLDRAARELHATGQMTMSRKQYNKILARLCKDKTQMHNLNKTLADAGCVVSAVQIMSAVHERALACVTKAMR